MRKKSQLANRLLQSTLFIGAFLLGLSSEILGDHRGLNSNSLRSQALEEFRAAKFGLFIHWGLYAIPARDEREVHHYHVPVDVYERYRDQFNPTLFDAGQVVGLARRAGMRYITFTTKHHDGFCIYDSALTDYKITRTPFGRDVTKELVEACHQNGLKIFLYYSLLDWHHPDYTPDGADEQWNSSWRLLNRPANFPKGEWSRYVSYYQGQIRELCTRYGKIDGFWFDGGWDKKDRSLWKIEETMALICSLQPQALINTHEEAGYSLADADYETPEHALTNEWTKSRKLLEVAATINDHYGYSAGDKNFKSASNLIQFLADTVSKGANLLLNVGPRADGTVQQEFIDRLDGMGAWLKVNGESIYGTQMDQASETSPIRFRPKDSGTITAAGNRVFVHVFHWPSENLILENYFRKVRSARWLPTGNEVRYSQKGTRVKLSLPKEPLDFADSVVVLENDDALEKNKTPHH
jgi:alpha-L-fucosidase